ncbi:MAG TPA: ABC transporter substrate-binding protein [Anaerolineales bacterium]|nr:ABC transporter substrate-binding protein [Anaerolineales bacterium]
MKKIFVLTFLLLALFLASCGGTSEPQSLRIAVLPILDALPMHVAQQQGYFAEGNLEVELVPVSSGPERDQLMQAGQVDGMINEIVSVMFYNQTETEVVIVRFARAASTESPVFSILAAPGSGIESASDLTGVAVGISEATVIDFMTDRVLQNAGLTPDEITTVAIPRIPDRLALLQSGELAAATLPEPATSMAVLNGATVVIDDSTLPEVGTSVITFSVDSLTEKPDAVRGFLAAVEKAVADLNEDPHQFDELLADLQMVPPPLAATFVLPPYVTASVPSEALWQDALDWVTGKGLITSTASYADSVDDSYLP